MTDNDKLMVSAALRELQERNGLNAVNSAIKHKMALLFDPKKELDKVNEEIDKLIKSSETKFNTILKEINEQPGYKELPIEHKLKITYNVVDQEIRSKAEGIKAMFPGAIEFILGQDMKTAAQKLKNSQKLGNIGYASEPRTGRGRGRPRGRGKR